MDGQDGQVLGWSLDLITLALTLGDTCIGCMVGVVAVALRGTVRLLRGAGC